MSCAKMAEAAASKNSRKQHATIPTTPHLIVSSPINRHSLSSYQP